MSTKRVFIFIMLVATLLTGATLTQAQNATASGSYVGALEALNGNQLQVSGLIFDISAAGFDDDLLLEIGTLAEIDFSATGGTLTAVYVDDVDADEFTGVGKITGELQAYTSDSATIGGITFAITDSEIDDDVVFAVGTPTEIRFTFADGVFSGYKIEADDLEDDTEDEDDLEDAVAYGDVEAIDGATITVAGVVFDISTAEIDTEGTLEVGVWVRVEFYINETGIAIATSVEFDDDDVIDEEDEGDDLEDFTLVGILESFEGSVMVVSGVTVDVSQAVLDDDDNIVVGALVKVEFDDVDGVLVAVSVEDVDDIDDVDDDFEDDDLLDGNDDSDDSDDNDDSDDSDDDSDDSDDDSCQVPAGWFEYEINSGDTLSGIAAAANISLTDLMTANCITDASLIRVDDEIYTPVQISSGGSDSDDDDDSDDDNDDDSDDDSDDDDSDDNDDDSDDDNDDDSDDDSDDDDDDSDDDDDDSDDSDDDDDN